MKNNLLPLYYVITVDVALICMISGRDLQTQWFIDHI